LKRAICFAISILFFSIAWCGAVFALQYKVINCGALPGAVYTSCGGLSVGWSINNRGEVVGCSTDSTGSQYAIIWDQTNGLKKMTLSGKSITGGYEINNNGVAIVDADRLWNGPDISIGFQPFDLNDSLQVVGQINVDGEEHAAVWNPSDGTVDLGIPDGRGSSWADKINNNGQVLVNTCSWPGGYHAYIWDPNNKMRDLGMLAGYEQSTVADINDNGLVIGSVMHSDDANHAWTFSNFIWDKINGMRTLQAIGMPDGYGACALNNKNQFIGNSFPDSYSYSCSYMWDSTDGLTMLPTLGGSSSFVFDINDNGFIVGESTDSEGNNYSCVWMPVPEPSSMICLLLGLSTCIGTSFALRKCKSHQ
jgi:uncharacterized membrane protein